MQFTQSENTKIDNLIKNRFIQKQQKYYMMLLINKWCDVKTKIRAKQ